jgi:hypothetical protein
MAKQRGKRFEVLKLVNDGVETSVEIRYDGAKRGEDGAVGVFFAPMEDGSVLEDASLVDLKAEVARVVKAAVKVEYAPHVTVRLDSRHYSSNSRAELALHYDVLLLSTQTFMGRRRHRGDELHEYRLEKSATVRDGVVEADGGRPTWRWEEGSDPLVPFTTARWRVLEEIGAAISAAAEAVKRVVGDPALLDEVAAIPGRVQALMAARPEIKGALDVVAKRRRGGS